MTAETISSVYMPVAAQPYYEELVGPLAEAGREELAAAIQQKLARVRGTGISGRLRRFDRDYLNGSLRTLKRAVLPQAPRAGSRKQAV
jgi:hypothetical protein